MSTLPDDELLRENPYPFFAIERDYERALQTIPIADLRAEIEAAQWLAMDVADVPGDSRAVAELQLEALIVELERRKRLWTIREADPLRPAWPRRDPELKARVEAVKAAWPIARFCRELLAMQLHQSGRNRWTGRCPLPGHDDCSPSFVVYGESDTCWCYGCQRGGDVLTLTGYVLGLERFYDRLERLEREAGIVKENVA